MNSAQKFFRINAWPDTYPNPHPDATLKWLEKMSKPGFWLPHSLCKKMTKGDCISIATNSFSRQRNDPFLKNIITGNQKRVFYNSVQRNRKYIDEGESLYLTPNAGKNLCSVYGRVTMVLFILSFETAIRQTLQTYTFHSFNACKKMPVLFHWRRLCFSLITKSQRVLFVLNRNTPYHITVRNV